MAFDLSWMAWTWHTAAFFITIAVLIAAMGAWEYVSPGGAPRNGVLGLTTTRGDRLFISLLGSAYIHLAWLALASGPLWWATLMCLAYAFLVFRFV